MMNFSLLPFKLLFIISVQFALSIGHTYAIETPMITIPKAQKKLSHLEQLELNIAEKMVLDIRYFCDEGNAQAVNKACRKAVTELPAELSRMISDSNIGGIVLFAENVIETAQIVKLTHDIQQAALKSASAKPIIISIDQEGGRVARFAKMTGFSGNMAIGATYDTHGTEFSTQVNKVLGKELKALGINNNYAPVVDVNTNADNPVINTRSYGEKAQQVAQLGVAAVKALQSQGVMATLKHFPGHGDTHVDSHIGLPSVTHDLTTIEQIDLAPFSLAIKQTQPAMIMTAHIQYPVLDSSTFTAKSGEKLIRPATMSHVILTDLLRENMQFDGIIATDALDMAGISHYFTEVEAVVETFIAGADLAVMPFKIRKPSDVAAFQTFIKEVAKTLLARINKGDYSEAMLAQSLERLDRYKSGYITAAKKTLASSISHAQNIIANAEHLSIEQSLANAAATLLHGDINRLSNHFIRNKKPKKIHLVVANQQEFLALTYALNSALNSVLTAKTNVIEITHFIADSDFGQMANEVLIKQADLLIATVDVKTASLVDIGGMDDLASINTRVYGNQKEKQQKQSYEQLLKAKLIIAKKQSLTSILIAKGSPYLLGDYTDLTDVILLNFDDRIYALPNENLVKGKQSKKQLVSPGFNAAMAIVFSEQRPTGRLSVSL